MLLGIRLTLGVIVILSLLSLIQVSWGTLLFLIFVTQGINLITLLMSEAWEITKLKNRQEQVGVPGPQGEPGPKGDRGPQGVPGKDGEQVNK